ncbi:MAG: DUF6029 family protein, partial [Candidatus Cloacimonadaceae bacterium]|nr:DUF6029 family protein [Candidatus Cloacimonadaceae bacterium]
FRSWEDIEFDQDNRIDGFLVRYDGDLRFKALYGGVPSRYDAEKYDLVYGADAEYPLLEMLRLGANAISQRNYSYRNPLTMKDVYDQRDILSARATLNIFDLEISGEYAASELYYPNMGDKTKGSALYTHGSYYFHPIQVGAAYKKYDAFSFRLHDIPLANYHGETLADNQSSGIDEEGLYGWLSWEMTDAISFRTHYAEAWNQDNSKKMNDFFTGLDWTVGNTLIGLEYAQIEKVDDTSSTWQIDQTPALHLGFQAMGRPLAVKLEYAYVERQLYNVSKYHYEPSLQADLAIGKLAVSLGAKTEWKSPADMDKAVYATNMELKYPIFEHTDLTVFAGKDAGGKVCRNGICRYVAPFQGIRAELTTRF